MTAIHQETRLSEKSVIDKGVQQSLSQNKKNSAESNVFCHIEFINRRTKSNRLLFILYNDVFSLVPKPVASRKRNLFE